RVEPGTPQGQAEELVYRAFEERNPQRKVELAREALALWPDCADAFVLLADHAPSRKQALDLYRRGVEAGERGLGPEDFGGETAAVHDVGAFVGGWRSPPVAAAWLRANDEQTQARMAQTPTPKGPLGFVKKWLREKLPQREDVWQADCRRVANPVRIAGEKV